MRNDLSKLSTLIGPMGGLKDIRPPGRSFGDWERWLREVAPIALDSPLGFAIIRRKRWLDDARRRGLVYEQAEQEWNATYERDAAAISASLHRQDQQRARALRERDGKRRPPEDAEPLFDYADEMIPPP